MASNDMMGPPPTPAKTNTSQKRTRGEQSVENAETEDARAAVEDAMTTNASAASTILADDMSAARSSHGRSQKSSARTASFSPGRENSQHERPGSNSDHALSVGQPDQSNGDFEPHLDLGSEQDDTRDEDVSLTSPDPLEPIAEFDWNDLMSRYHEKIDFLHQQENQTLDEFTSLCNVSPERRSSS
jgi:hypothetical protein